MNEPQYLPLADCEGEDEEKRKKNAFSFCFYSCENANNQKCDKSHEYRGMHISKKVKAESI